MDGDAFRDWATGPGGLIEDSARSYVSYLQSVENNLGIDVAAEWDRDRLRSVTDRLQTDDAIHAKSRANQMSALAKYEQFRSLTGA